MRLVRLAHEGGVVLRNVQKGQRNLLVDAAQSKYMLIDEGKGGLSVWVKPLQGLGRFEWPVSSCK